MRDSVHILCKAKVEFQKYACLLVNREIGDFFEAGKSWKMRNEKSATDLFIWVASISKRRENCREEGRESDLVEILV